jgi:hypothetical protein
MGRSRYRTDLFPACPNGLRDKTSLSPSEYLNLTRGMMILKFIGSHSREPKYPSDTAVIRPLTANNRCRYGQIIVIQTKLNVRVSFMRFCQRTEHERLHKPDGTEFAFVH